MKKRRAQQQTQMTKQQLVRMLLKKDIEEDDQEILLDMLVDKPIAVDVEKQEEITLTKGEKLADRFSSIAGSWPFIICFSIFLTFWVVLNTALLKKPVDNYPFVLLNLLLSCVAALQAPVIMMSQNRASKKDSLRNQNDYETDLKSELILEDMHDKIEQIIKNENAILKYINAQKDEEEKQENGIK